ncbi:MAG TPA: type II toxin-antitoxin system RelE/ParE family toxin [Thermoanaerobaculia bacterium]|nr:type II toxin-antitoxin system RelE/ParE family toxin [Thermoanaerobaculia bacterium]
MGSFDIDVLPTALAEWSGLATRRARSQVADALEGLRDEPRPPGSFRLIAESKRRLYLEDAVIAYLVDEASRTIWILEVTPRRRARP